MADGNLQLRAFPDDRGELRDLPRIVRQAHREDDPAALQLLEGGHHLRRVERAAHPVPGDGRCAPSIRHREPAPVDVQHRAAQEALRVCRLHFLQIGILVAVDDLLDHDGGAHLRVIHIGEEDLRAVAPVNQERREHLALLAEEEGASARQRPDGLPVYNGLLPEPEVGMCVDFDVRRA